MAHTNHYSDAPKIKLVQDNYSTYSYGTFYEYLPPDTARALRQQVEFHHTPKHGFWLDMAKIEFLALSRQCLDRRAGSLRRTADGLARFSALSRQCLDCRIGCPQQFEAQALM